MYCRTQYTVHGVGADGTIAPPPLRALKLQECDRDRSRPATSFLALTELTSSFLPPSWQFLRAGEQPAQHPCLSGNGALEHWVWRLGSHSKCAPCSTDDSLLHDTWWE
jgi:hypothetical protein